MTRNGKLSCRSSSGLLDSMTYSAAVVAEFHNASKETEGNGLGCMLVGTKGFVNISDSPKTKGFVNGWLDMRNEVTVLTSIEY